MISFLHTNGLWYMCLRTELHFIDVQVYHRSWVTRQDCPRWPMGSSSLSIQFFLNAVTRGYECTVSFSLAISLPATFNSLISEEAWKRIIASKIFMMFHVIHCYISECDLAAHKKIHDSNMKLRGIAIVIISSGLATLYKIVTWFDWCLCPSAPVQICVHRVCLERPLDSCQSPILLIWCG
jgi:hypothetical protein